MTLAPGARLDPYEIVAPLGAGGLGEVYRARDTRLAREVAIKVLPERLANDADALARLEREVHGVPVGVLANRPVGGRSRATLRAFTLEKIERLASEPAPLPPCQRAESLHTGFFPRWRHDLPRRLRILCHCSTPSGFFLQEKWTDQVDREREDYCRVLLGRHLHQRLEVAQLEGDRVLTEDVGCLA